MADPLITQAEIEEALDGGPEQLRRLCGDDGTGQVIIEKVDRFIAIASEDAYDILRAAGWSNAQIVELANTDPSVKHQIIMMFRHTAAQLKDEFRLPEGGTVFSLDDRRARDMLRQKASTRLRTTAEENPAVGTSALIRPRATAVTPPRTFTGCGF